MISYAVTMILSVLCAYGVSIAIVQKGRTWPIRRWRSRLRIAIRYAFGHKAVKATDCVVCCSFWAALLCDVSFFFISGHSYFAWPLSGFMALGFTWTVMETINAIERRQEEGM